MTTTRTGSAPGQEHPLWVALAAVPNPRLDRRQNSWVAEHNRALTDFIREGIGAISGLRNPERAILSGVDGVRRLVDAWPDGRFDVLSAGAVGDMLDGLGMLLNYDLGRLQGGPLADYLRSLAERVGLDPDTREYVGRPETEEVAPDAR